MFNIGKMEKNEDEKVFNDIEEKEAETKLDHAELVSDFLSKIKSEYTKLYKVDSVEAKKYLSNTIEKLRLHANHEVFSDDINENMSKNDCYFSSSALVEFAERQEIIN